MSLKSKSFFLVFLFSLAFVLSSFGFIPVSATSSSTVTFLPSPLGAVSTFNAPTTLKNTVWAGYGIVSPSTGVLTAVRASFKQPIVKCNPASTLPQATGYFAAMDGVSGGGDFEVLGTAGACAVGASTPLYGEVSSVVMSPVLTITAGHVYSAVITESAGTFKFVLKDITTGVTSKGSVKATALLNAAECIVDRAALSTGGLAPLANFGTISFGKDYTGVLNTCYATASGKTMPIGAFSSPLVVVKYVLYNGALTLVDAATSALTTDKSSFKVTWKAAGP